MESGSISNWVPEDQKDNFIEIEIMEQKG